MPTAVLESREYVDCSPQPTIHLRKLQKCVLLIEDSEDAMRLIRLDLRDYGRRKYRLEWADCLSEGIRQVLGGGIDIVLLDLGLPESSGFATYAWLRKAAEDVPILVLTGDRREETEFAVVASGIDEYLVKDQISGSMLVEAIEAALSSKKSWIEHKQP